MKYIVYKTINTKSLIDGVNKYYIGVHGVEDINVFDGYIGCGVNIYKKSSYSHPKTPFQYAVNHYGIDAFHRETLYIYDNKEDAYNKEKEIVDESFIQSKYTYNVSLGGLVGDRDVLLYQFDLNGNLIKIWNSKNDASIFYNVNRDRFNGPIRNKCAFFDSFWSYNKNININEYNQKKLRKKTYLYDYKGVLIDSFESRSACAKYIQYDNGELCRALKNRSLIMNKYYVSDRSDDIFTKKRHQYTTSYFYIYNQNEFVGKFYGKQIMNVINLNNWSKIYFILNKSHGWYNDFYVSLQPVDKIPIRQINNGITINVYYNNNLIDVMYSKNEVHRKYNIQLNKLKGIEIEKKTIGQYTFIYKANDIV